MAKKTTATVTENVLYVPVMKELALNGYNLLDAMEIGWKVKCPTQFKYLVAIGAKGVILGVGKVALCAAELDAAAVPTGRRYWFKVYLEGDTRLTPADRKAMAQIRQAPAGQTIGTGKKTTHMQNCAFGVI